jgi:hypothetical protein
MRSEPTFSSSAFQAAIVWKHNRNVVFIDRKACHYLRAFKGKIARSMTLQLKVIWGKTNAYMNRDCFQFGPN